MSARKNLWQLSFRISENRAEEARAEAYALTGANPATHSRAGETTVRVDIYLDSKEKAQTARRLLHHRRPTVRKLPYANWAESWKKHFRIQRIGKRVVIKPSWKKYNARRGDVLIELDPGLSFGTGQHPTTRFCLRMIERFSSSRPPRSFLDIGTGSGILAIAAAKFGYAPVRAVDNDAQAIRVARANFRTNVGGRLGRATFRVASLHELTTTDRFDIVAANLLADLIIAKRRKLTALVAPGGHLILAGILVRESPVINRVFRSLGLKTFACERNGNWAGFVFHKSGKKT